MSTPAARCAPSLLRCDAMRPYEHRASTRIRLSAASPDYTARAHWVTTPPPIIGVMCVSEHRIRFLACCLSSHTCTHDVRQWKILALPADSLINALHAGTVCRVIVGAVRGTSLGKVVLISLEPWGSVWRRNQHLTSRIAEMGLADRVTFVNPPTRAAAAEYSPLPGVTVISPRRRIPKRLGGLRVAAQFLKWRVTRRCDALWINDPTMGAWLSHHRHAIYDVTDDWRCAPSTPRERRRLIAAEDVLAMRAHTIVCSEELGRRWKSRYGVDPVLVRNAADVSAITSARPRDLGDNGPHVGYIGTLHQARIDIDLVLRTAETMQKGKVHLVGPDSLTDAARSRLRANQRIVLHGSVPASEVPTWIAAFDVLICPHVVTDFTLSLDAIKAYEYLATPHPVVATPASGFQELMLPGLYVVDRDEFPDAVLRAAQRKERFRRDVPDWNDRARCFAAALVDFTAD